MRYTFGALMSVIILVGTLSTTYGQACLEKEGYFYNSSSKSCKKLSDKNIYSTSTDFLAAEGLTCKSATDGCNTVQVINGKLGAMTMMYCEDIYGENGQEQWSCLDKKIEDTTIGFLSDDEQKDYKYLKISLGEKISTKILSLVESFGEKILKKLNYDMEKSIKIVDKAITKIELHLMTSRYSNQKVYQSVQLLKYELKILKNRLEQNSVDR